MERGHQRLNALLIAVAGSLGILIGLVGAAKREPGARAPLPRGPLPEFETSTSRRTPLVTAEVPSEPATSTAEAVPPGLRPSATVHVVGFVFLPGGGAAANARIVLGQQHARADAQGRFEFAAPAHQEKADLVAFLSGHEPALQAGFGVDLVAGGTYEARLVLGPPTLTLSGHVRDERGEPAKNWTVELDGLDPLADLGLRERVRTDAEGAFRLTDVPAGIHVVRAWKEQRELARFSDPVDAGSEGVRVVVGSEER